MSKPSSFKELDKLNNKLFNAVKIGDVSGVSKLLHQGADAHHVHKVPRFVQQNYYASVLGIACEQKNCDMIKVLIENGASPLQNHQMPDGSKYKTVIPFVQAIKDGDEDLALMMIEMESFSPEIKNTFCGWSYGYQVGGDAVFTSFPHLEKVIKVIPEIQNPRLKQLTERKFTQKAVQMVCSQYKIYLQSIFNKEGSPAPTVIQEVCDKLDTVHNDMTSRNASMVTRGRLNKLKT